MTGIILVNLISLNGREIVWDGRVIRECTGADFEAILSIINDGAQAYRSVIPVDRWLEPYMPAGELRHEINTGVLFAGAEAGGSLVAVMGLQIVKDVTLIRHAYVRTACQRRGEGSRLLQHLMKQTRLPVLIGTWKSARWALRFYEKHAFNLIEGEEKDRLLRSYWNIPSWQVKSSVVMADQQAIEELVRYSDEPFGAIGDDGGHHI
ncbi:MAG: hypothetical protein CFH41_00464 [Alphaproteobacteria bacterium MarineAlpha11_Bin1]|nr:MAG: hypothetical protein CFH41_00464 [Alphaproteobacteria bacterium MarineAlpha11_Bin1]|tara:strand:+ start:10291 stop:10911 length:621 start_codon:yes stop_codon:yes gene_type:complete